MPLSCCVFVALFISLLPASLHAVTSLEGHEFQNVVTPTPPESVKKVHVIFMNHLDVGYDGISPTVGFTNNVINRYFQEYFPRASQVASSLHHGGYVESFIYTTHPWLVKLYLDCPPHLTLANVTLQCPNDTQREQFVDAVTNGYITWHAGPMNMQIEFMSPWLLEFGLNISQQLDQRFNITRKMRVLSQRDVPGMTQAIIPYLVKNNIVGVSVGVNPSTAPPALPKLFRWQYGGQEVMATWHPGGYPLNPGPGPDHPGGLSVNDCAITPPPVSEALCFAFRTDNSGPPVNVEEVLGYYEILRKEFPHADIGASTLEKFIEAAQPIRSQLPVVTQEVGDTWIQGIASDPLKCATYRAVARVMGDCLEQGLCSMADHRVQNASLFLVKLPEHTWGLPSVGDNVNWSNEELARHRHESNYKNCSTAWQEQREYVAVAIEALGNHPVVKDIYKELEMLVPSRPDVRGYKPVDIAMATSTNWTCGLLLETRFGVDGSIVGLSYNKVQFADPTHPLGQFIYDTFNADDFKKFGEMYNYNGGSAGYVKNNITENAHPESRTWPVVMTAMFAKGTDQSYCDFWLHLELVESEAWRKYGAPVDLWLRYTSRVIFHTELEMDIELHMFDKTSTRLPEAIYFSFKPLPANQWLLSKLDQPIDPLNVVLNGSQYQHSVDDNGVQLKTGLFISSPDVPLVCPITDQFTPRVLPAPLQPIRSEITGMAFNIYNNIWDTNYIFWYPYLDADRDFKARFKLRTIF